MVFNMKRKEIILGVVGIIALVLVAFAVANVVHDYNADVLNEKEEAEKKEQEDKKIKVDGVEINFKTYRVDQKFFLNVPDIFTKLDETTLKEKYNYNERPELVFMSSDDLQHVFISTTNQDMTDEGLEDYLNYRKTGFTNMTLIDSGVYKKHDKTFGKLILTDANSYYNFRFFTLDNKLVTVEFNTRVNDYQKWKDLSNEVMDSLCFSEDDIKKYSSN